MSLAGLLLANLECVTSRSLLKANAVSFPEWHYMVEHKEQQPSGKKEA